MQTPSTKLGKVSAMLLPLLLAACASEKPAVVAPVPTPAVSSESVLRESQGMAHLSERLKAGEQMIQQGNVMVREGQTKIDEGNRMIDEGNKIKQEAEDSYRNIKN